MSSNPYGQFIGTPMSDEDIDALLTSTGYGVISLCREGEPYSIPLSFGYDGECVYFGMLEDSPHPQKLEYLREGATARLLVTDVHERFDWRSVAIDGPLRRIDREGDEWEHLVDALEDNAWFMRAFEQSDAVEEIHGWELRIEEIHGVERREGDYE